MYDNGTFTPIEFPAADQTHITGFNNNSQILGWYDRWWRQLLSLCIHV